MIRHARGAGPRGQAVIIVAFSMVVLLGIAAIVVDLGLSWMLRRHEQNAADPAAIAAARHIEDGDEGAMRKAACFYAQENGFFVDDEDCAVALDTELEVLWPPSGPHAGDFAGRREMVLVVIHSDHPSFFGRIFGQSFAHVATGAVAARESANANSNSLVALDPTTCGAGKIHGGGDITIEPVENPDTGLPYSGGYVHVNSECGDSAFDDTCSGSGSGAFVQGGNGGATITAPHLYIHGTCKEAGGVVTSPVTEGAPQIGDPLAQLIGPRQEDYPAGHCPTFSSGRIVYVASTPTSTGCSWNRRDTTVTLTPGVYYGGWDFSGTNVSVRLQPGIYIIAGGGIKNAGASVDSMPAVVGGDPNPAVDPARVLIFSTDNTTDTSCTADAARCTQGAIKFSGRSSLRLWGLDSGPWRGLMMWQDGHGSNPTAPIELVGQGTFDLAGTMYAPKADVKIDGRGASTARLAVQIISWTWDVGGNGDVYMPYDPNQLYKLLQRGLVH